METLARHPDHERLVKEVPSWYRGSAPEMGYVVEERPFGYYGRNVEAPAAAKNQVIIHHTLITEKIAVLLEDVRTYFGGAEVWMIVDDRNQEARLSAALVKAGCQLLNADVFLAHIGPVPKSPTIAGLRIERIRDNEEQIRTYAVTNIRGFANSEDIPDESKVKAQVALRRAEMRGDGRFYLAWLEEEPAAALGLYSGQDWLIFQLATRVPFRRRGLAKALLCRALQEAYAEGARSVIINVNPENEAIQLYRSLGFQDEVYWRKSYRLPAQQGQVT